MARVTVKLPDRRYDVLIEPDALTQLGAHVRDVAPHARAALVMDRAIADTHGQRARQALEQTRYQVVTLTHPAGEQHKNLDAVAEICHTLAAHHVERKSPLIALGGGVIGDTAGYVAASFLRGIPLVQCPTTLLAMVDASVGGKTGVNLPQGKNLVGAFYQPHLVLADVSTLSTLPQRELRCGLAECIKHAMIRDAKLLDWILQHHQAILSRDADTLVELVRQNVAIKADVVMQDEKESGLRAILNFGHTFAHAIEAAQAYGDPSGYLHGEAVALGMVAATHLAVQQQMCPPRVLDVLLEALNKVGLPTQSDRLAPADRLFQFMQSDKKVQADRLRLVLPQDAVGQVILRNDIDAEAVLNAWRTIMA